MSLRIITNGGYFTASETAQKIWLINEQQQLKVKRITSKHLRLIYLDHVRYPLTSCSEKTACCTSVKNNSQYSVYVKGKRLSVRICSSAHPYFCPASPYIRTRDMMLSTFPADHLSHATLFPVFHLLLQRLMHTWHYPNSPKNGKPALSPRHDWLKTGSLRQNAPLRIWFYPQ